MNEGQFAIRLATHDEHPVVHAVQMAAFAETSVFPIPSSALSETVADIRRAAEGGKVVVGLLADRYVAAARYAVGDGFLSFERVAVLPSVRGRYLGVALVRWLEARAEGLGLDEVRCSARSSHPDNRGFYRHLGYEVTGYTDCYGISALRTHFRRRVNGAGQPND